MKNRKRSFAPKSRYADLRSDFMIKRIFSQEDILLSFLNVIIPDKHFTGIRFNHTERFGDRKIIGSSIFDVCCFTNSGEEIVVEVQNINHDNFPERLLFYSSFLMQGQRVRFNFRRLFNRSLPKWNYDLKPMIIISIINFNLFKLDDNRFLYSFHLKEDKSNLNLTDSLSFYFLELPSFLKSIEEVDNDLDKWAFAFKNMSKLNEQPEKIKGFPFDDLFILSEIANFTNKEYAMLIKREIEIYERNSIYSAGAKTGYESGHQKGLEKGLEKGRAAEQLAIAVNMKNKGVPNDLIAEYTGLSKEDIEAL